MAHEDNKAIVRRYYNEMLVGRDMSIAGELFDPDFKSHPASGPAVNLATYLRAVEMSHAAFPDLKVTIEDQIAEEDRVVTRWTANATQTGPYIGIPPTGRLLTVSAIHIHRLANGKLAEHWEQIDVIGVLQQLGVLPPLGQPTRSP